MTLPEKAKAGAKFTWSVESDRALWLHESREEFFADYRKGPSEARVSCEIADHALWFQVIDRTSVHVEVAAPSRAAIEGIFAILENAVESARLPEPPPEPPTVFIGHGGDPSWRDLKDHLQDQHGFEVQAYEIGARAGHAIRDVLEDMLEDSAFALLVLTGEDDTADGHVRARQNVVHELGLFQGRLGFSRAIVLLEEGVEQFSNLQGINQIRFRKGAIRETFGDVLATLRREFGPDAV